MNCGVASWQDMTALIGARGRGLNFDGVQGRGIQTTRTRWDNGIVMKRG